MKSFTSFNDLGEVICNTLSYNGKIRDSCRSNEGTQECIKG